MGAAKKLAQQLASPLEVQQFIKQLPYNVEKDGETLKSAEKSLKVGNVHCFEAAFVAAAILEHHGHDPVILSLESQDYLDHVLYLFQERGKWGTIGRSREPGLEGRAPRFNTITDLVDSYYEPYVDPFGRLISYQIVHLDEIAADWRNSEKNLWSAENYLIGIEHVPFKSKRDRHYKKLRQSYLDKGPIRKGRHWW